MVLLNCPHCTKRLKIKDEVLENAKKVKCPACGQWFDIVVEDNE